MYKKNPDIEKNELVDIATIQIDTYLPIEERFTNFINSVKNPYSYMVDGIKVKIRFTENGEAIEDIITKHYIRAKNDDNIA